ncbi:MAG: hypothetical protein LBK59_00655 [Bifidobacteriaceae bacterium]|jgi:hypothetical protein|nr:hypothetical protein [Bifidobacteriaceae bacterium]
MSRTTIAIRSETRARIKVRAARESKTIDEFLQLLLDGYECSRFWQSFEDVTPQSYAAAIAGDGDSLDEDYAVEDQLIDAADV